MTENFDEIDHHRHARDVGLGGDQVEERHHRLLGIEQALVHVDVDDLRAVLDLVARDLERGAVVAIGDELAEARRAGDVGALADVHERDRVGEREGFEAGEPQPPLDLGDLPRRLALHRLRDGVDVRGRGAAAAADDVDEAGGGELLDQPRHEFRAFVVAAEFVGQAGVRIGADQRVGDARELRDVRAHLLGAERAVQSDRERRRVAHRVPERFRRLPGEQPPGAVGDGAGDHHRQRAARRLERFGDGVDRGLGVERVEDRLDQQDVGAALDQAARLLAIGDAQLVEGDGAEARIADVRRDRGGAVGRPERAGDEARAAVLLLRDVGGGAREPRALDVELVRDLLHAVVGLRDRGRRERVGRDDVGAGAEIFQMDFPDRVGLREDQQVVVAADLAVPGIEARAAIAALVELELLDHGAHGAVEHQDALGRDAAESFCSVSDCWHRSHLQITQRLLTLPPSPRAAARAGGTPRRRGRRGSWCRSGSR